MATTSTKTKTKTASPEKALVKKIDVADSLALKYRPQVMEDLIGNDTAKAIVSGMLERKKFPATILLHGGTGMGKCVVGSTLVNTRVGMRRIDSLVNNASPDASGFSKYEGPMVANAYGKWELPEAGFQKIAESTVILHTKFGKFEGTPEHPMFGIVNGVLGYHELAEFKSGDALVVPRVQHHEICVLATKDRPDYYLRGAAITSIRGDGNFYPIDPTKVTMEDGKMNPPLIVREWCAHSIRSEFPSDVMHPMNAYDFMAGALGTNLRHTSGSHIEIVLPTQRLAQQVRHMLMMWNIRSELREGNDCVVMVRDDRGELAALFNIPHVEPNAFYECRYIGPLALRSEDKLNLQQQDYLRVLQRTTTIESVTVKDEPTQVYDLSLAGSHSFQTECHISHNTTMARMLARYINCDTGNACGTCSSCRAGDASPDVLEMNMATERGIDEVRALIAKSKLAPRFNKRIFILDELHQCTPQAKEALLKPLEEPAKNTMWILCTTEPEKLPKTVLGRCQQLNVTAPTAKEMVAHLRNVCRAEGVKVTEERLPILKHIAEASMGHSRNALQMLETFVNIVSSKKDMSIDEVQKMLTSSSGGDNEELAAHLLASILGGQGKEAVKLLYTAGQNKDTMGVIFKLRWLIDFKLNNWAGVMKFNPHINQLFEKKYKGKINVTHLIRILSTLVDCEVKIKTVSGLDERIYFSSRILNDMVEIVKEG